MKFKKFYNFKIIVSLLVLITVTSVTVKFLEIQDEKRREQKHQQEYLKSFRFLFSSDNFKNFKLQLLNNPNFINKKDPIFNHYDLLDYAIENNHYKHFKLLIDNDFNINKKDNIYLTSAICRKRINMIECLIAKGINKNVLYPVYKNDRTSLKKIIDNNNNKYSRCAMYEIALRYNSLDCMPLIFSRLKEYESFYLYQSALFHKKLQVLKLLKENNININSHHKYEKELTVLNYAYQINASKEIINYLKNNEALDNSKKEKYFELGKSLPNNNSMKILRTISEQ